MSASLAMPHFSAASLFACTLLGGIDIRRRGIGGSGRDGQIRTADLSLRRRPLYPSELRPRILSLLILKYFDARRLLHPVISATKLYQNCIKTVSKPLYIVRAV